MKKIIKSALSIFLCIGFFLFANAQNVGIGTNQPTAKLHVTEGDVLFMGPQTTQPVSNPPVSGAGHRMFWFSSRAAFRGGGVNANQWERDSIGFYSFGFGRNVLSSGEGSIALGLNSRATDRGAVSIGTDNAATSNYSLALGFLNSADGILSTTIGSENSASGRSSLAAGTLNQTIGEMSIALGRENINYSKNSITMGTGLISNTYNQVVVGRYNAAFPIIGADNTYEELHPVFVVGHGSNFFNRRNAFSILNNGRIGIGTDQPKLRMHIAAGALLIERNSGAGDGHLQLEETTDGDGSRISFRNTSVPGRYWDMGGFLNSNNSSIDNAIAFRYSPVGNNFLLYGDGNAWLRGSFFQNSDSSFKMNLKQTFGSLNKLSTLNGYHYYWKDQSVETSMQTGLLAQEVELYFPELVKTNPDGEKSVNYIGIIPHLIEAIKELKQEIELLKKK